MKKNHDTAILKAIMSMLIAVVVIALLWCFVMYGCFTTLALAGIFIGCNVLIFIFATVFDWYNEIEKKRGREDEA